MKQKTLEIPLDAYENTWKFVDYYPKMCKDKPSRYTNKLRFELNETCKRGIWNCFETYTSKLDEKLPGGYDNLVLNGRTFLQGNRIFFAGSMDLCSLFIKKNTVPFYYDKYENGNDRLFIKDKFH